MPQMLNLVAGHKGIGTPVYEEVVVEPRADAEFELLKSPGLVLGLAAGDVFRRSTDGSFCVVKRGGNLCIQLYANQGVDQLEQNLAELVAIGGRLDGKTDRLLAYTIPARVGFPAIERVLNAAVAQVPDAEWYFGNVYDPEDGVTPLNWW